MGGRTSPKAISPIQDTPHYKTNFHPQVYLIVKIETIFGYFFSVFIKKYFYVFFVKNINYLLYSSLKNTFIYLFILPNGHCPLFSNKKILKKARHQQAQKYPFYISHNIHFYIFSSVVFY